ncbi:ABC transporter ATP-binding protein [Promicromonospora sp. NPDC090134]|uniref:ABC transporter ATP-binding protein n=1 Tax=Promicromonospora sp. NPDC090134 TaxID=3364408 RepID=UPI003816729F
MSVLEVAGLEVRYGDLLAVDGVGLTLAEGETLAVLGANGAGKSTLLAALAGTHLPTAGTVLLDAAPVTRVPAHRRVRRGVALVPEGRRLFPSLTVEENLLMGRYPGRPGPWDLRAVYDVFPHVAELRDRRGSVLSGGQQQAVAIGRALLTNPRVLLLDEVSLGLAPSVVTRIYDAVRRITAEGTTALVVEQDLDQALRVADRVQCLLGGRTVLEAPAAGLDREAVADAYFGIAPTPAPAPAPAPRPTEA